MKSAVLALALLLLAAPAWAQVTVDPSKPDAELTKEEAEIRITEYRAKVADLQRRLESVNNETAQARQSLTKIQADIKSCNDELYALVGASAADVENFRNRLGAIKTRVAEMSRMSDDQLAGMNAEITDLENRLNALRREKIALLPEFYNDIIETARQIKGLRRTGSAGTYTVGTWQEDRDCLWNIAKRETIYGNAQLWPKIWQANTDQIRNPDLIYPGQVLKIPPKAPLTDEEERAARAYYRRKRAATGRVTTYSRTESVDQDEAGSGR